MSSELHRGDRVQAGPDGPLMVVVAASDHLAICRWQQAGETKEEVFNTAVLRKVAMQLQQQPVPHSVHPGTDSQEAPGR